MLTTVEKGLPHAQEEEKTALTHVAECRCESARPQSGQRKPRRISDVDKARNTILQGPTLHQDWTPAAAQQGPTLHQGLRPRTLHQGPRLHEDKKGQKLRVDTPAASTSTPAAASLRMLQRSQASTSIPQGPTLHQGLRPRTLHQGPRLHEDRKGQKLRAATPAASTSTPPAQHCLNYRAQPVRDCNPTDLQSTRGRGGLHNRRSCCRSNDRGHRERAADPPAHSSRRSSNWWNTS